MTQPFNTLSFKVLDHGFVRLDDMMADDLSVVNSARVSLNKKSDYAEREERVYNGIDYDSIVEKYLRDEDVKLINFLMRERHGTPFEHNAFRFHIKAPIFVFREWQRHRIGSFNEWSARYSELKPEFYIPRSEHIRTQVGKPGAYSFETLDQAVAGGFTGTLIFNSNVAFEAYEAALHSGVAKELARLLLPVNIFSEMYWTVNARSLMNFLSLRNSEQAQFEIRQYAKLVENRFKDAMPHTHEAFVANGRVAP